MYPDKPPTSQTMYKLLRDRLNPEVRDLVANSREVTRGDSQSLRKFLKRQIGKLTIPLSQLHELDNLKVAAGGWRDAITQVETVVSRDGAFPKNLADPKDKKPFEIACFNTLFKIMPVDLRKELWTKGLIKQSAKDVDYKAVKGALIGTDVADQIINAGLGKNP